MALLHVIKNDTYSTVRIGLYDKQSFSIQIEVKVYESELKKTLLSVINHDLMLVHDNIILEPTLSDPPINPSIGDRYFVTASATGAWENLEGSIMEYADDGQGGGIWHQAVGMNETMTSRDGDITPYWFEDMGGYYKISETYDLIPCDPGGKKLWNTHFDPAIHEDLNENLIKSVYEYLMSLPQYANAVAT